MTAAQQSALDRAIERATSTHIGVTAQGHFRDASCDRFFLTTAGGGSSGSGSGVAYHVVRLMGHHLVCDCLAAQRRSSAICVHRASVHLHLVTEAVRKQWQADQVQMALEAEQQAVLYRSNDAVDRFKH